MNTTPIFAVYVNTSNMSNERANEKIAIMRNHIAKTMPDYITHFLTTENETRIECIWPKFLIVERSEVESLLQIQLEAQDALKSAILNTI